MKIHLKKGEKIYINGAVIKVEQRCSLQLLNNVTFLLESHVMQAERIKTPFEQLYFVLQTMLIDPESEGLTRQMYWHLSDNLRKVLANKNLLSGLSDTDELVKNQQFYDALKILRGLFPLEKLIMHSGTVDNQNLISEKAVA
jgi:flagellar biosynthesis repressor protein FlbT